MLPHYRFLIMCTVLCPAADSVQADDIRVSTMVARVVSKALPPIREGGAEWIADKQCLSCHRVSFQVWALNRASEAGFESDRKQLREWNTWATTWKHIVAPERRDDATMEKTLTGESDTVAQLLLGRPAIAKGAVEPTWFATYRSHLMKAQQKSGSWKPVGQLPKQKRPLRETEEVTTMWSLLALKGSSSDGRDFDSTAKKAIEWLGTKDDGVSTEWWAARLLLERALGNKSTADNLRRALLDYQREDGGWGWLTKDDSDALATGIALFALARDGVEPDDPSVKKAVSFLADTQKPDGSWAVKGTKEAYRNDVTDTASYWGNCWAVIGLLEFDRKEVLVSERQD